jgi:hypothetical protein
MTLLMSAGMAQPTGAEGQKKLSTLAETARVAHATRSSPSTAPVK